MSRDIGTEMNQSIRNTRRCLDKFYLMTEFEDAHNIKQH